MPAVVGIDLGTTFTVAALATSDGPQVLDLGSGPLLPSVVAFLADTVAVGAEAVEVASAAPQMAARSFKRHMGSPWVFNAHGRSWSAVELSAMVLGRVAERVRAVSGERDVSAVVTVPAYFSEPARAATAAAVRTAGMSLLGVVNEPTAAALAYGLARPDDPVDVVVVDVGGGTTDVSVLRVDGADVQVVAVSGDNELGGDDWDRRLAGLLADRYRERSRVDLRSDPLRFARLVAEASRAKVLLSSRDSARIGWSRVVGPGTADGQVTRFEFEEVTADLAGRVAGVLWEACASARVRPEDADVLLLVGGSTRMPQLVDMLSGLADDEARVLRQVDADLAVAAGAAVAAGSMAGLSTPVRVHDVTPLTLGVETAAGLMEPVVRRNTPVPVVVERTFTTESDNQHKVSVGVFQGERPIAAMNRRLAMVELEGLPPARRGEPEIEVTFSIDESGLVQVSVAEETSGGAASVNVAQSYRVDDEAVGKALADARAFAGSDRVEATRLRLVARVEALLAEASDALKEPLPDPRVRTAVESLVAASDAANGEWMASSADVLDDLLHPGAVRRAVQPLA